MLSAASAMLCSSWVLGSPGCGGGLLVFADAAEQVCEVGGGEFPVEWLRGLVVAAGEGEQGSRPGAGRPRGGPPFADDAIPPPPPGPASPAPCTAPSTTPQPPRSSPPPQPARTSSTMPAPRKPSPSSPATSRTAPGGPATLKNP